MKKNAEDAETDVRSELSLRLPVDCDMNVILLEQIGENVDLSDAEL